MSGGLSYEGNSSPWDLGPRMKARRERDRTEGEQERRGQGGILECSLRCLVTDKDRYATPGGLGPSPVTRTDNR